MSWAVAVLTIVVLALVAAAIYLMFSNIKDS